MTTSQMAAPFIPSWETLPSPVLEEIFQCLGVVQLAQMRLMCRHWNATICSSPVLMKKFVASFDRDTGSIPEDEDEQEELSKVVSGRYRTVCINVANTIRAAYGPLWDKLGQTVQHLTLSGEMEASLQAEDLLEMLRLTPNLAHLKLNVYWATVHFDELDFSDVELYFKCNQLEELELGTCDAEWIPLLSVICPNLKAFQYNGTSGLIECMTGGQLKSLTVDDMMPLFLALEGTLESISIKNITINEESLRRITSAKNLQLKRLTLTEMDRMMDEPRQMPADDFTQMCKTFPALESLKFECCYVDSQVLNDLHINLGQLRTLCIKLFMDYNSCHELKILLENMPQLEYLGVQFATHPDEENFNLELQGVSCPNLKKLKLGNFKLEDEGLAEFFQNSPNIKHLILHDFEAFDKADLANALSELKSLEILDINEGATLWGVAHTFDESDFCGVELNSVRSVSSSCVPLATSCPNAESVYLRYVFEIADKDVVGVLQGLPKLRKLRIDPHGDEGNTLSDAILDLLAVEGRRLEELRISLSTEKTSQAARDRLTEALRNIVRLQIDC